MKVIADDPWNWFLFEDDGKLYLEVLVESGAMSFSVAAELTAEQADRYKQDGARSLALVSGEMRHSALMRTWRISPLPDRWNERSVAAVQEWQRDRRPAAGS